MAVTASSVATQVDVAIIGAGFGGIGVGIELLKRGRENFVIFEGEDGVGGSWRTNTYPGCACDVPSHLYSYSFEPNPRWSEAYSRQPDILAYIEHCADKYGIRPHLRLQTRVTRAEFDERRGVWRIETGDGAITEARVLVPATGILSHPRYPDIEGRDTFAGKAIHAARWDDSVELDGKRVGVLGTGASAIQIVPNVADRVGTLTVFQRTPSWVLPKRNRVYTSADHRRWERFPWFQRFARLLIYVLMEAALPALLWLPRLLRIGVWAHERALRKTIADPALREQLTPKYQVGCKRTLVADDWFETFNRESVTLVSESIERITPKGILTSDGVEHELDVLIFATGYQAGAPAFPYELRGLGGVRLEDYWGKRRRAYFGMAVSHFPNLLMIMGPNTAPGHTSVLVYQEAQYRYVASYAEHLLERGARYIDVREDVQNRQWDDFQRRMAGSSWQSGCHSWYLNEDGTNSALWPGFAFTYVWQTRRIDLTAYNVVRAPAAPAEPVRATDLAGAA